MCMNVTAERQLARERFTLDDIHTCTAVQSALGAMQGADVMVSSTIIPGLLLLVAINLSSGFYIQPEVLFLSEHPESQQVVAGSGLSLSCSVQLRGLSEEEGGLNVPIVWWSFNHSSVSSVFPEAVESSNRSSHQFLRSTLHISHTSPNHTGTYHCNIEDGTDKGELRRLYSHLCTNHACHPFITASNPATITVLANSTVEAMVEVQNDNSSAPPVLISPHNGTTLTTNTSHPSQHTLSCSVQPPYNSHFWVYNGEIVPELSGKVVNVSSIGVYQCFAGNNFGFSVATVRLVPAGLTNPPGQPHFYEIPRPDSKRRPAYIIWWHPPSYPSQLDTDVTYSLSTLPEPTLTRSNSTEVFIPAYSYYYLVVNEESELSERSPSVLHRFDDSQCRKQVYFPPRLFANCDEGRTNISWTNNPNNSAYYSIIPLYSINGPVPGQYYINVTCSLPDNTVFATGGVFTEEGSTVFDEELPIGTECVFEGAATPATGNGPAICLDPTTILYNTSTCLTTAYIQFENDGYVAKEEDTSKVVCMNSRGYNFSAEVTATYESNTTEVMGVEVSVAGDSVCVSVEIVDDSAVSGTTNISLSLQSNSARVTTGPPVVLSILDNDELLVVFTNNSYEVVEGGSVPVCLKTDDDLRRSVLLVLTVESSGNDVHTESELILDAENRKMCILFNTSDNSYVEGGRSYTVRVNTSDEAVNLPLFEATVNVYDDDVAEVHFTETEYRSVEGRLFELCVETADDLRTLIHLNLTIDGIGGEQLLLPGSFSLGPRMLRSCRISSSQDNNAVDSSRIYTMMLQTHDSFIDVSSSETYLIIENDDVAEVHFAETEYRMVEGRSFELCVETGDDLQISIQLNLTIDGIGREQLSLPRSFSLGPGMLRSCRISSSQDNNAVDSSRIYTMMLQTHDSFIDVSSSETYLIIENDDVEVHFTETEYRSVEGRSFELCVETGDDDLRTFIQLILIIDGTGKEQLSFPESFMLGPSTIRSCQDADSQDNDVIDNDRIYTMTLQTLDSFVRVPTSETYLIIENNDTVLVGFFETSYEMHAGELKRVCVQAVGKLQKSVSVNLSVRETTGADAHDYVDLDKYEILTFFPNATACVWLNASSAITETTLLILELSGGKDVDFENGTASVTITPTPGITSPQPVSVSVIVVSILVPSILVLLICVVCVVLLRQHQNASVSARDVILPTKPFEFKEEMLEPRLLHCGSVSTVFEEPLALSPGETSGKMGLVDAVSVSSTDELHVMPELVTGSGGEREVEENDEVEGTSALSPVVKTLHTSHSDTSTATTSHSLCNKSVSNSSHHEYIASDSIMQYSYPPSVNGCGFRTAVELKTANDQCSSTLLRPVQNSPTNKSSGIGSAGFGTDNSGDVGLDFGSLGMERESGLFEGQAKDGTGSMGLLNDADLSTFFAPVVDSGIGMDVDGHGT